MKKFLLALAVLAACSAVRAEDAEIGADGIFTLEKSGVSIAPRLFNSKWSGCKVKAAWGQSKDGVAVFSLVDGEPVVEGRATAAREGDKVRVRWDFEVKRDYTGKGLCLAASLPCDRFAGGTATCGNSTFDLPKTLAKPHLGYVTSDSVVLAPAVAPKLSFALATPCGVMFQDDRQWRTDDFAMRLSLAGDTLKAGERHSLEMTVSAEGGIASLFSGKLRIVPGADWIPFEDTTDVIAGSALDFSTLGWVDAPAGKYGRVVAKGGNFEFAGQPGVPQRFYGCNLCFTANYLSASEAQDFCERLRKIGYNALRIHHYERDLCDAKDGTTILPARMAELDHLLNACIENGIYLTTDLYVSRAVPWRTCGIDRDGNVPMDQYKELVLFHDGAFRNYLDFSRALLAHVNPKTGRRWADEPAFAFLALVNEGNPGNYGYAFMKSLPEAKARWEKWLAEHKAAEPETYRGITDAIPENAWENTPQNCAFNLFLTDVEIDFAERMKKFVREEIGSEILLTDLSCWKNPVSYQLVRRHYDYVDDHFYVDHPSFLEKNWQLPSKCPNANPARGTDLGFQGVIRHRLLEKPFTITEFNFSAPGQFRGVGGMMLGAQAALQDYDGIWRFAWSHSHDQVLRSGPVGYFNVATDPLQRATERAVLTLYLRRDMRELSKVVPVRLSEDELRHDFSKGPHNDFADIARGWGVGLGVTFDAGLKAAEDPGRPDGQVLLDRENGFFGVVTPRTAGFFAESGTHAAGPLVATVSGAPAAVWVSSLDDRPIERSGRLLLTHVTDVQDTDITYGDKAKRILLAWGRLPHLMRNGTAEIELKLAKPAKVHALNPDGSRRGECAAEYRTGKLRWKAAVGADPKSATYLYEIDVR
jgi:hypothetical protein